MPLLVLAAILFLNTTAHKPSTDSLVAHYQQKAMQYLDKEQALQNYYTIDSTGVSIFASANDKANKHAEHHYTFKEIGQHPPANKLHTLKGLKIAIDPGHCANTWQAACKEKKCIEMKAGPTTKLTKDIRLIEAQLTLATATLLKQKLEAAGAIVKLTDRPAKVPENTGLENKQRANAINKFQPDLTIVIHYNVDEKNTGWKKPSEKDFNMAFVGGSFMKNELSDSLSRSEFLRLLVSDDLEQSIRFSNKIAQSFTKHLEVPLATTTDAEYLIQSCLPTEAPGVFCRNLTLTRLVHGTIVYGETLFQDNRNELNRLSNHPGNWISQRVEQVATAYFEGVLSFVQP